MQTWMLANFVTPGSNYARHRLFQVGWLRACRITTVTRTRHINLRKHNLGICYVFFCSNARYRIHELRALKNVDKLLSLVWWQAISLLAHDQRSWSLFPKSHWFFKFIILSYKYIFWIIKINNLRGPKRPFQLKRQHCSWPIISASFFKIK